MTIFIRLFITSRRLNENCKQWLLLLFKKQSLQFYDALCSVIFGCYESKGSEIPVNRTRILGRKNKGIEITD